MKYKVQPSTRFTKDLKLCKSRGWDTEIIKKVIKKLSNGMPLEEKYKNIVYLAIGMVIENAIFNLIGCLYIDIQRTNQFYI